MTDRDGGRAAARGAGGGARERWASDDAWDSPERHRPDWVHEDRAGAFRGSPRRRSPGYEPREQQHHRRIPPGPQQQRYYGPLMAPSARGPSPSSSSYHLPSSARPWTGAAPGPGAEYHRPFKPLPQQRESFSSRRLSPQFPAREGGGVGGLPLAPSGRGGPHGGPGPGPPGQQPPFRPARPPPPPYAPSPHRRPPFPHTPSHGSADSFSPSKPQVDKPRQRLAWAPEKEKEMERCRDEGKKLHEEEFKLLEAKRKIDFDVELANWEVERCMIQIRRLEKVDPDLLPDAVRTSSTAPLADMLPAWMA